MPPGNKPTSARTGTIKNVGAKGWQAKMAGNTQLYEAAQIGHARMRDVRTPDNSFR
jgi:hypothetical protein